MASQRGKSVLKAPLYFRRSKNGNYLKKRGVIACCGIADQSAQVTVFDDYDKIEKPGVKPRTSLTLLNATINCSYSPGTSPPVCSPANSRLSVSPSPSSHSSSQGGSGSGIISGGSGSGSGTFALSLHLFTITVQNGDAYEFGSESENDRLRWVKLLNLLVMFPFSTIPDEPSTNPIKDSLRSKLDPQQYNADSVWLTYILPEEVGTSAHIIGTNVIALRSGKNGSIGQLDIYNPGDPSTSLVTWDRDKMRRTGKTGHLVFIEIGRRCYGGPGLVWMYPGLDDAQALRETLHNFLFQGDGTAVAIPTQTSPPLYDVPRASFDTSLPPSYKRHNSIPGYNNHVLKRSSSQEHDSGYPGSPVGSTTVTPPLYGPPVRLDKHPSIRRKNHPREISRSESATSFSSSSYGDRNSRSTFDGERSILASENSDHDPDVLGQMDPDSINNTTTYDVPRRASEGRPPSGQFRVVNGGNVDEYEHMVHPNNKNGFASGYVLMSPASTNGHQTSRAVSSPIPVTNRNGIVAHDDDTYHHLQRKHSSPQNSVSPRNRLNYEQLPPISEGRHHHHASSNYENYPLPRDLQGVAPIMYQHCYENVERVHHHPSDRRSSLNHESYINVDAQVINTNSNNCHEKRFSLHRQTGGTRTTMTSHTHPEEGYVVIESESRHNRISHDSKVLGGR